MSQVPFADLHAQYQSIKSEIDAAIESVIKSSAFIRGPFVEKFEDEFAKAIGVNHCVSCANGTDAIYIAMHALGVKAGDEVITTSHSWIATSETISQIGAKVVFCDTDKDSFTIDASQIEAKITPRTVGIIPVHLTGNLPTWMPSWQSPRSTTFGSSKTVPRHIWPVTRGRTSALRSGCDIFFLSGKEPGRDGRCRRRCFE